MRDRWMNISVVRVTVKHTYNILCPIPCIIMERAFLFRRLLMIIIIDRDCKTNLFWKDSCHYRWSTMQTNCCQRSRGKTQINWPNDTLLQNADLTQNKSIVLCPILVCYYIIRRLMDVTHFYIATYYSLSQMAYYFIRYFHNKSRAVDYYQIIHTCTKIYARFVWKRYITLCNLV
jgi:hypothetical protein